MESKEAAVHTSSASYISNPFTVFIESFKKFFKLNIGTYGLFIGVFAAVFAVLAILLVIVGLTGGATSQEASRDIGLGIALVGAMVLLALIPLSLIIGAAFSKYNIETSRGNLLSFKQAWAAGRQKWLGFLGVSLLVGLVVVGGLFLLIVPGLIFVYWFAFAPSIYIDQEVGVIEAMKKSKQLVKGKGVEIFGVVGSSLLFIIPAYIPVLGWLYQVVFTPVASIASAYRYTSARALELNGQPKPATHTANYIAIFTLPVLLIIIVVIASSQGQGAVQPQY